MTGSEPDRANVITSRYRTSLIPHSAFRH